MWRMLGGPGKQGVVSGHAERVCLQRQPAVVCRDILTARATCHGLKMTQRHGLKMTVISHG